MQGAGRLRDGAASLGFAIIAKDAAATIGNCLDSIRPYCQQIVVCVDTCSTDATPITATEHGADIVVPLQVSDWHECPEHGRVLAQHFARARDESFTHLDRSLRWWGWIDSDDVLDNGEGLARRLSEMAPEIIGAWLPYQYATAVKDDRSQPTTIFHRERILRSDLAWRWEGRVHETVTCDLPGPWAGMDDVIVRHQIAGHKAGSSALRNLLLLELDLEEDPNDRRAIFYMGNQHFAMGNWAAAVHWYERLARMGSPNEYELWQAYCYQAMAYLKLDDLDGATQAAYAAIDIVPQHPEPYYHLASVYHAAGQEDKALFWINEGRSRRKTPPPFFVFKNPMDYSYNNRVLASDVLASMGQVVEARQELEAAYRVLPDDRVQEGIDHYRHVEEAASQASAFVALTQNKSDLDVISLWSALALSEDVRAFGRCRDVAMPAMLRMRAHSDRPRIVFWCGQGGLEEWAPPTLNKTGIGGSETAVIEIAKRFAADGWRVDVYGNPGRYEGVYGDIGYWQAERADNGNCDVLVSWRSPKLSPLPFGARARVLWCHDLNYGAAPADAMRDWNRVLGVSAWHAAALARYYGLENTEYVPNGIDISRFEKEIRKIPFRCVYASSPDRGLEGLLELWPRIVEAEPIAELHIAYGWENYDKWIAAGYRDMAAFKDRLVRKMGETSGVVWRGRLPQDELAKLYSESYAWLYPSTFTEVSCISAMEAMAGGAVPVTSRTGALPETIGNAGILVDGYPHSRAWRDFYAYVALSALMSPDVRMPLMYAGKKRAEGLTWHKAYSEHWKPLAEGLLEGKKEAVGCAE